jgi:hypothetical protein
MKKQYIPIFCLNYSYWYPARKLGSSLVVYEDSLLMSIRVSTKKLTEIAIMKTFLYAACATALLVPALVAENTYAKGAIKQTVDVMGQSMGMRPVASPDGAKIIRTKNGVTVSINMPTPMSQTYTYPDNAFPGVPEVFSGWLFFFNEPENCATPNGCIPPPPPPNTPPVNDFTEGKGGVYNFAGHPTSGGGSLNMVGHISVGETQFGGPFALENPTGAEIHLAVAPHGILIPDLMPQQMRTPAGGPPLWWVALLPPPAE